MACLNPFIRIDENAWFSSYFWLKYREKYSQKKPWRGGVFFNSNDFLFDLENDNQMKFRDFLLNRKDCSFIPCGCCESCLLKYSRDWSIRTFLESEKTDKEKKNYFLTLTYDDLFIKKREFINNKTSEVFNLNVLEKKDIQNFLKRFRKKFGDSIKYYLCGEYGPRTFRPHYHLILMNVPFINDLEFLSMSGANALFKSETISKLWQFGFHSISEMSVETIFYTSHYCLKKANKKKIVLKDVDDEPFQNEFQLMSRRPGLAEDFFKSRIFNENLNFSETHIKLKDIQFEVASLQYYHYLFDKFDLWQPIKPVNQSLISIYGNSYLTAFEQENLKNKINENHKKYFRIAI